MRKFWNRLRCVYDGIIGLQDSVPLEAHGLGLGARRALAGVRMPVHLRQAPGLGHDTLVIGEQRQRR